MAKTCLRTKLTFTGTICDVIKRPGAIARRVTMGTGPVHSGFRVWKKPT